jgi:DNA-binding PadR family transcriptional regulator
MKERDIPEPGDDAPDVDDEDMTDDAATEAEMRDHLADHVWAHHRHRHHGPGRGNRARARYAYPGGQEFEEAEFARPAGPPFGPFGPGFHGGPGGPGGPWGRGRGRGRARRGDVRAAALALLAEQPMNGYQIIQQIAERSGGLWRVSPGSVYPALSQLEDEGLIVLQAGEAGRRGYVLTDAGRAYVAEHPAELRAALSALSGEGVSAAVDMRSLVRQVHLAAFQVVSAGSDAQVEQARKVLTQTRRALYRILAEDEADDRGEPRPEAGEGA